jgi:hypothetical protein
MPAKTTQQSEDLNNPYGYSDMDWAAQLNPAYAAAPRTRVLELGCGWGLVGIACASVPHARRARPPGPPALSARCRRRRY